MRNRFKRIILAVGGKYYNTNEIIKTIRDTVGNKMPTKAQYDDGSYVENNDELVRVILNNGMIHYVKKGSYIIKN